MSEVHSSVFVQNVRVIGGSSCKSVIDAVPFMLYTHRSAIRRGMELVMVYRRKYSPAPSRSVWDPHRAITIRVGIRVASKVV